MVEKMFQLNQTSDTPASKQDSIEKETKSLFQIVVENPEKIKEEIYGFIDNFVRNYTSADDLEKSRLRIELDRTFLEPFKEVFSENGAKEYSKKELGAILKRLNSAINLIYPYLEKKYSEEIKQEQKEMMEMMTSTRDEIKEKSRVKEFNKRLYEAYKRLGGNKNFVLDSDGNLFVVEEEKRGKKDKRPLDRILANLYFRQDYTFRQANYFAGATEVTAVKAMSQFVADRKNDIMSKMNLLS